MEDKSKDAGKPAIDPEFIKGIEFPVYYHDLDRIVYDLSAKAIVSLTCNDDDEALVAFGEAIAGFINTLRPIEDGK